MLQGRVISCEFKSFEVLDILNLLHVFPSLSYSLQFLGVYVPNCGRSFDRRRAWDHEMKQFVSIPRAKPLLLCGDLNVAPEWHDVSHPKWFRYRFSAMISNFPASLANPVAGKTTVSKPLIPAIAANQVSLPTSSHALQK
jgi:exonuclease III